MVRKRSAITKQKDAARKAAWAIKNKTRLRGKMHAYYLANKEKILARSLAWAGKNKERVDKNQAEYRLKNAHLRSAKTRAWCRLNRDKKRKMDSEYRAAHPGMQRARLALRRAIKRHATPSWANSFFISEAYHLAVLRTKALGFPWTVDHIVPLTSKKVCGLHVENNLRVIPGSENSSKGNRHWPDMP
jgi:hypothetical protein